MKTSSKTALSAAVLFTAAVVSAGTADAHPVNAADFQQIELARGSGETGEPISLAVLPDRSVLHTARGGTLRRPPPPGPPA